MTMTLHFHPLASFCWKALIGLYELEVPFEKHLVDLSNEAERAAFARLWPLAKFPVLRDEARGRTVPESTVILEYVDRLGAGGGRLIPADPERALEVRLYDRLYDSYVHLPMQKIVGDRLRPEAQRDPGGVAQARAQIEAAYALADGHLREGPRPPGPRAGSTGPRAPYRAPGPWAMGADFTLVDCAAFPALFYGNEVVPLGGRWKNVEAYLERLKARASVARVLEEAQPFFGMFPR
jgi:glutathione S-transferase